MKKINVKTIYKVAGLAVAGLMVATVAAGLIPEQTQAPVMPVANAQEVPATDFWLEEGAAVRYGTSKDGDQISGLRYTFQIKTSVYEANNDYTQYGILIAPATYELTPANVFGDAAIYDWAVKVNGEWTYDTTSTKTRIANLPAEIFEDEMVGTVAVKQFYGSLVDLKESNITKEFRGIAYVGKSTDGVNYTYEFVTDESNIRSMAYVAQRAKEDPESSAELKAAMDTLYLSKASVLATASSYKTEYYFEQADGTYALDATKTATAASTVNATVTPNLQTFDNYVVNTEMTDGETIVYANDKTTVKAYYSLASHTVTYDLGELKNDEFATISAATSSVQFSKTLTLLVPTCDGYVFVGWKNAEGEFVGKTLVCEGDETLTAVWEKDESADRWGPWSPVV